VIAAYEKELGRPSTSAERTAVQKIAVLKTRQRAVRPCQHGVMAGLLLETKLHPPRRRRGVVARPRLSERLARTREARLTLVSAPPGFGKTTVLTQWLTDAPLSVAWLSLDKRDNDTALFWSYLVAALQAVAPGLAEDPIPPLPPEAAWAMLLNKLNVVPNDVVLVLDDYHVIQSPEIHDLIAFFVEHLPPQIHLVIATRTDPALPLARLRARGELVEIRATDLRFTLDEAAAYLNEVMGLTLSAEDLATLERRTEGWIAALQLAALSMQGRDDVAGFIAGFAGDDRYIVDYLVAEVLARQSTPVRNFLLRTCVLSRLSGPLCDAVTGQHDGKLMLDELEVQNLFVVPLDDRREWYRYHHLFADVLRVRLMDEQPQLVAELHRRASDWYDANGERPEAIRHAMAGDDQDRAADLVELAIPAMRQRRQEMTIRGWLEAIPPDLIRARPGLSIAYVGALMASGDLDGVEARLQDVEHWLIDTAESTSEHHELRRLPMTIAVYRAAQARMRGDIDGSMTHARRAFDLTATEDHLERGAAAGLLALAYWTHGDLDTAHDWWANSSVELEQAGHLADVVGVAVALADIRIAQGRLREAQSTYEQGLAIATGQDGPVLRGAADMHVGLSELLIERNELDAASQQLLASRELGDHLGLPQNRYRSRVAMGRLRAAEGDLTGAIELLDEAERAYDGDFYPEVQPVAAVRAAMWAKQGEHVKALRWATERGLSATDNPDFLHEFEHLTLARILMGQNSEEAAPLLARLLLAAEDGGRLRTVVAVLVLQSVARQERGDVPAALVPLQRAVMLGEREGFVRVFADEGPRMTTLLRALPKQAGVRRLLGALSPTPGRKPAQVGTLERLSERELDVIRLLATDLDGPGIARELVVSLNTVRTHTKNIYAKLGVNNRRSAVRRAKDLHLVR
jgi:LuxR family maltose regulon positive regulatory protein